MTTTMEAKLEILADLWMNYRDDEEFTDFISYNDLGLPLAYVLAHDIVKATALSNTFIEETFELLLSGLGVEDTGFESLNDLLEIAETG
jgi:hypothetical protein